MISTASIDERQRQSTDRFEFILQREPAAHDCDATKPAFRCKARQETHSASLTEATEYNSLRRYTRVYLCRNDLVQAVHGAEHARFIFRGEVESLDVKPSKVIQSMRAMLDGMALTMRA